MNQRNTGFGRLMAIGATLGLAVALLAGCGQQSKQGAASSTKTSSSVAAKAKSQTTSASKASAQASSQAKAKTPWDAAKDQQLKAFIDQWAPTMGQAYTEYDGHHPLKTSTGVTYPDALNGMAINGDPGTIGWSPQGNGNYDYNVVAIYNYDGTVPPLPNRITYVFAFHHSQPVVLVDQSRDGEPALSPTQNADVRNGFTKVANGTAPAKSAQPAANQAAQSQALDPKTVGVLLAEYRGDNVTADNFLHFANNTALYPYIVDSETADSQIPYRINKTDVTYGVRDPNHTTSENVFIDHTVSLQDLQAKYYHTPAQIAAIKAVVARLKLE
ncbi:DUF4767 domain-containing protein [Lacticaseibacillus baoqingensis]|uniref:DUF4767 domain-containing protein n=1 Tax=Lacticaseibacillus baoqingensis TaxID=2486013 RepID=A0ABW4E839_9LACO|nr:DUF4767 domain-containing protein [Lacticaseibacillus baoqingensis]